MYNNQNRRRVLVDEELFRQLLNQAQLPGQRQVLVPQQEALPAEYTMADEDTSGRRNRNDIHELDLNQNRNQILDETFYT
ncbi:MAG: hypothetical protein WBB67_12210 [bacterium]